jgi:hypothetical protein
MGRDQRRQNTFLMYIFFFLAVLVYFGANTFSPKLVVTVAQGEGDVYVNGELRGRTDEVIRSIAPGTYEVTVLPDSVRFIALPQLKTIKISWGLTAATAEFEVFEASDPPDSLLLEAPSD